MVRPVYLNRNLARNFVRSGGRIRRANTSGRIVRGPGVSDSDFYRVASAIYRRPYRGWPPRRPGGRPINLARFPINYLGTSRNATRRLRRVRSTFSTGRTQTA